MPQPARGAGTGAPYQPQCSGAAGVQLSQLGQLRAEIWFPGEAIQLLRKNLMCVGEKLKMTLSCSVCAIAGVCCLLFTTYSGYWIVSHSTMLVSNM